MKKIALLFSAALLLLVASCMNQEIVSDEVRPLKLNITVAPLGGPDTKAAKTDWVEGDKLNCWIDDIDVNHKDPDIVITRVGEGWAAITRGGITLKDRGYFSVVYESSNDLAWYSKSFDTDAGINYFYPRPATYSETSTIEGGAPCYCRPLICTAQNIEYTYDGYFLNADISGWRFESTFKVLITGVPSEYKAADFMLKTYNNSSMWPAEARSGFFVKTGTSCPEVDGNVWANGFGLTGGVQESDGIAFYYNYFWAYNYSDPKPEHNSITFKLYVGNSVNKSYTVNDKFFANTENKSCFGISIDYSKFN